MRRNRNSRVLVIHLPPRPGALLAEYRRRRDQCTADLAAAKVAGDFVRYRALRERWDRYFARDPTVGSR